MLRFLTAGESHGPSLVVIVEGLPAGLPVTEEDIAAELARRRLGYGRGPRMRFEQDEIVLHAGIRHGRTLGSPVAVEVKNTEWPKWTEEMSAAPGHAVEDPHRAAARPRRSRRDAEVRLRRRPRRARAGLGAGRPRRARSSARFAKTLLGYLGVSILSHIIEIGAARAADGRPPGPGGPRGDRRLRGALLRRRRRRRRWSREIKAAAKVGDSLGGIAEVLAYGVPVGLGSHVHWDRKLDGLIAQALMSIHAVKGVELGDGFELASRRGSEGHDAIYWDEERRSYFRDDRARRRDRGRHLDRRA